MAQNSNPVITVQSLRGGLNNSEPSIALADDMCTVAENVEFFNSTMGERRLGCTKVTDLPASITGVGAIEAVTWMGRHLPTNVLSAAELWALAQDLDSSTHVITHRTSSAWATVTPDDAYTVTAGLGHRLNGASLHGKFFIAGKTAQDLLHVWDGTNLRRCSLAAPAAAPTAADTAPAGSFTSTRYYRVREALLSGSTVLLRSEPSAVRTFAPAGTKDGATITKPSTANTYATHWEIEASTDNSNFYRLSRIVIGTTTYTDNVAFASGYANATGSILSEDLTAYTQLPSGKYLSVDSDRLLIGGSWENSTYSSRLWWTPVFGSTGTGNDERLDMTVNPYIDLDGFEGGELTGLSKAVNGYLYAFKWNHIYKIVRTGQRTNAYTAVPITKERGALPGSLVEAVDQAGNPAQYFLDPTVGPMRIGTNGLESCGTDIRTTWDRMNLAAIVPCHGVFYQAKNQVHFWLALDDADYPNFKIIVHCDEMQSTDEGAKRGWVTVPVGDRIADAHCSLIFSDNVDSADPRSQNLVPYIGKKQWTVLGSTIKDLIQRCDTGTTDAFVSGDDDAFYYGQVQSKPYTPTGLLARHGVMSGKLIATAVSEPLNDVYVKVTKDFGLEELTVSTDVKPYRSETVVVRDLDNLSTSEMTAVQFTFGDLNEDIFPSTNWELHRFSVKIRQEQTS
jgi:hypothetical protein